MRATPAWQGPQAEAIAALRRARRCAFAALGLAAASAGMAIQALVLVADARAWMPHLAAGVVAQFAAVLLLLGAFVGATLGMTQGEPGIGVWRAWQQAARGTAASGRALWVAEVVTAVAAALCLALPALFCEKIVRLQIDAGVRWRFVFAAGVPPLLISAYAGLTAWRDARALPAAPSPAPRLPGTVGLDATLAGRLAYARRAAAACGSGDGVVGYCTLLAFGHGLLAASRSGEGLRPLPAVALLACAVGGAALLVARRWVLRGLEGEGADVERGLRVGLWASLAMTPQALLGAAVVLVGPITGSRRIGPVDLRTFEPFMFVVPVLVTLAANGWVLLAYGRLLRTGGSPDARV